MTLGTLVRFLFGGRNAILTIAASRQALWLGLVFVLAAGFAREYDGEDLLHEPGHLLIPLGASLALFGLVWLVVAAKGYDKPAFQQYREFLTLYWMTAPLALLYGIPFERLLSAGGAMRANLALLGLVALWRVALMSRAISVLYGMRGWAAFPLVMLFGDTVLLLILTVTPLPIISIMGGVRLSESEQVLQGTAMLVTFLGMVSWPVWLVWALAGYGLAPLTPPDSPDSAAAPRVRPSLWAVSAATILIWLPFLPATQSEQRLRGEVERALQSGRIDDALRIMSAHERDDFPPHWDPPPRIAYGENQPDIVEMEKHLRNAPVKNWVRDLFIAKLGNYFHGQHEMSWAELSPKELNERLSLLESLPERVRIVKENEYELQAISWSGDYFPPETVARVNALLDEAGISHEDSASQLPTLSHAAPPTEPTVDSNEPQQEPGVVKVE